MSHVKSFGKTSAIEAISLCIRGKEVIDKGRNLKVKDATVRNVNVRCDLNVKGDIIVEGSILQKCGDSTFHLDCCSCCCDC